MDYKLQAGPLELLPHPYNMISGYLGPKSHIVQRLIYIWNFNFTSQTKRYSLSAVQFRLPFVTRMILYKESLPEQPCYFLVLQQVWLFREKYHQKSRLDINVTRASYPDDWVYLSASGHRLTWLKFCVDFLSLFFFSQEICLSVRISDRYRIYRLRPVVVLPSLRTRMFG
jgi:hypothetical protein